jgi:hypothetical protein
LLFGELALSRHLSSLSREDSRFNWANFWGAGHMLERPKPSARQHRRWLHSSSA